MTSYTYSTIRHAPLGAYIGICDGSRHALARIDDPGAPVAAQRHLTACRDTGKPPAGGDMAAVSGWLDRHAEPVQMALWEIAA